MEKLEWHEQLIKIKVLPIYMYYQCLFCEVLYFTPGVPWKSKIDWKEVCQHYYVTKY